MAKTPKKRTARRYRRRMGLIRYERVLAAVAQRGGGVRELGMLGARSLVIINGGALIGLFTFLGNNETLARQASTIALLAASVAFVLGLVAALIAVTMAYLNESRHIVTDLAEAERQALMAIDDSAVLAEGPHPRFRVPSIAFGLSSLVLFSIGALTAVAAVLF